MRILVTGSEGQLGRSLQKLAPSYPAFQFRWTDIDTIDITDPQAIEHITQDFNPSYLINCAAYTAVDKAEDEPEKAHSINAYAPGLLAEAMERIGGRMIHISTDYVFDGKGTAPYQVDHPCHPASHYGITKLAGEEAVLRFSKRSIIIRTSWLYSEFGQNFVKTMMRLGCEKEQLNVVADQTGSPTWATDLARAILQIIPKLPHHPDTRILHYANKGEVTWFAFARQIMNLAGLACNILPIRSDEYPVKARRPQYSVLDTSLIQESFGVSIPPWQTSLAHCIALLRPERN